MIRRLTVRAPAQGLHEITREVRRVVAEAGLEEGLCTLYVRHTSASLIIQENADPAVCRDLEAWLNRLVPELDPLFTHLEEGPDDMPSHVKSVLTASRSRSRSLTGTSPSAPGRASSSGSTAAPPAAARSWCTWGRSGCSRHANGSSSRRPRPRVAPLPTWTISPRRSKGQSGPSSPSSSSVPTKPPRWIWVRWRLL